MPTTETYRTMEQRFFQDHLKTLKKRDLKLYHLYREGFKKRIHSTIPEKFVYLYAYDLINLHLFPDREMAIKELIYLHSYTEEKMPELHRLLTQWIGDMYLYTERREEAFTWYHRVNKSLYSNMILSYYNYERELWDMPLEYYIHLFGPHHQEEITTDTLKEFSLIILFLNERVEEDYHRSILDFLNIRSVHSLSYNLFESSLYGGPNNYHIQPFKEFIPYERMTEFFKILYLYTKGEQKTIKREMAETWRKNIPKKIREYLAEWNILQIVEEEQRRPKKRIILDEHKIQKTMEEQQETAGELQSIMHTEEREHERERPYQPIYDLTDIFQSNERETLPQLQPVEKKILKNLWEGPVDGDTLKEALGKGLFLHQVINHLNERVYPYLGTPLIEQRDARWSIVDEHKPFLETMDLTEQEES